MSLTEFDKIVKDLPAGTPKELVEILREGLFNVPFFMKTFWPEIYDSSFNDLLVQIHAALASGLRRICIKAPRGIGKTSTLHGIIAHRLIYRLKHYIPYISNSGSFATLQTDNIKAMFAEDMVKQVFGDISITNVTASRDLRVFSRESWTTPWNQMVFPRGWYQQIRGALYRGQRPDFLLLDDIVKKEEADSDDINKKMIQWFYSTLLRVPSQYKKDDVIVVIDTPKGMNTLFQAIQDDPNFTNIELDACLDDDFTPAAPEYMTRQELIELHDSLEAQGQLEIFYQEIRCKETAGELQVLTDNDFRHFDDFGNYLKVAPIGQGKDAVRTEIVHDYDLTTVVIGDPAKTKNMKSAESAITIASIHQGLGVIYIRESWGDRVMPAEYIDQLVYFAIMYGAIAICPEKTSLEEYIMQPLRTALMDNNVENVELIGIVAATNKAKPERIKQVIPYYRKGRIFHNPQNCGKLEEQLKAYPNSSLWDRMDTIGHIPQVLEKLDIVLKGFPTKNQMVQKPHVYPTAGQIKYPVYDESIYGGINYATRKESPARLSSLR